MYSCRDLTVNLLTSYKRSQRETRYPSLHYTFFLKSNVSWKANVTICCGDEKSLLYFHTAAKTKVQAHRFENFSTRQHQVQ